MNGASMNERLAGKSVLITGAGSGLSINFAMPPDADVLGKSYEEMQPLLPA